MVEHVLFLRHGQTRYLLEKRISGRSLEIPILEEKEIQCDIQIDCVLCSPALRCRQTLEPYLRSHPNVRVCFEQKLLERGMGVMEGQYRSDMAKAYPNLFHGSKFRLYETPPEGESFEDFHRRVMWLWQEICQTQTGTILICSHNQVLRMLSFVIGGTLPTQAQWEAKGFPVGVVMQIF